MKAGDKSPIFNKAIAKEYDNWYAGKGRDLDNLEKQIMFELIQPEYGQKLLDVGCGTGHQLKWFDSFGLKLAGVDISGEMLDVARKSLNKDIKLYIADAHNLPYKDNEFDIVTIITTIAFVDNPEVVLKEALRVSKNKVFLGILNKYSILSLKRKIKSMFFRDSIWRAPNFFSLRKIKKLVRNINKNVKISWLTTHNKNPFANFIGILIKK